MAKGMADDMDPTEPMDRMAHIVREIASMAYTAKGSGSTNGSGIDSCSASKSCGETSAGRTGMNDASTKAGGATVNFNQQALRCFLRGLLCRGFWIGSWFL